MFKKIQNIIFISLFMIMIAIPMISWGVLNLVNIANPEVMEVLDFDLNEKRNKATMSEIIDANTVTLEIENYYNDRLPYRSVLISFKRFLDAKIEEPYKNNLEGPLLKLFSRKKSPFERSVENVRVSDERFMDDAVDKFMNHGLYKDEIDPYDDTIEFPIKYLNNPRVISGQSNWLYLNENNIAYYQGTNKISTTSEMKKHVAPYVKLKKMCDKVGKNLVILICPEKEEIYPEYMPTMKIDDEVEVPIDIREYLKENTDIKYIYPKEELLSYKKNYLLYKKYDSHWNSVGGYLAANEIKKALGLEIIPLRDLKIKKVPTLDADLAFYGNTSIESLPMTFKYEFEDYKLDHKTERVFAKNEATLDSFTTHCEQGFDRKLFLLGDSFREAMEEFLIKDFNEFYCNTFLNATDGFIKEEVKRASDIVITLVERNENIVLPQVCEIIYNILQEYENDINAFIKNSNQ